MKEVYLVWDYDANEAVFATENYNDAQEILYDEYLDTLYYEFLWHINYLGEIASDAYENAKKTVKSWFRDSVRIEKIFLY